MRVAVLVLAVLTVVQAAVLNTGSERKVADEDFLNKQKVILKLLIGLGHDTLLGKECSDYDIASNVEKYHDPKVVEEFLYHYKHGFLPKDESFTMGCMKTRLHTITLANLLFHAKEFDDFYKTACWARKHIHGEQFAVAFFVALVHRPDCREFSLPPVYEVFPHAFVPADLLHRVFDAKMTGQTELKVYVNNSGWERSWHSRMFDGVTLSSWDSVNQHTEERISYFREDVGLNEFIAKIYALYPTWVDENKYNSFSYFRRGEQLYYVIQQIFARYSLERFANEMPETELLYWDKPIKTGYNPKLVTLNGNALFPRAENMVPYDYNPKMVSEAREFEDRIYAALDLHRLYNTKKSSWVFINSTDGIDSIGHLVFGTPASPSINYYGNFFYRALNAIAYIVKTGSDRELVAGALGKPLTVARDPAFYLFLHRVLKIFQYHKNSLPAYTQPELTFPGVKIEALDIDPLITYFDRFPFEITNAVPLQLEDDKLKAYRYVAEQFRLNHKPFHFKLIVSSDKEEDAIVRVFIGPKYDSHGHEMSLEQARLAYVELDRFPVKITNGQNVIERDSKESTAYVAESESFRSLFARITDTIEKKEPFYVTDTMKCGLPERLMLPKGWESGQPFVIFAIVSPHKEKHESEPKERRFDGFVLCGGSQHYDKRAFGFPFDRAFGYEDDFHTPNMIFKDVKIYHKEESDLNRVA